MITEVVPAARLRPGDQLVTNDGLLQVSDVRRQNEHVHLLTGLKRGDGIKNSRLWSVRLSTLFRRLVQSRRIDMRPDLHRSAP